MIHPVAAPTDPARLAVRQQQRQRTGRVRALELAEESQSACASTGSQVTTFPERKVCKCSKQKVCRRELAAAPSRPAAESKRPEMRKMQVLLQTMLSRGGAPGCHWQNPSGRRAVALSGESVFKTTLAAPSSNIPAHLATRLGTLLVQAGMLVKTWHAAAHENGPTERSSDTPKCYEI